MHALTCVVKVLTRTSASQGSATRTVENLQSLWRCSRSPVAPRRKIAPRPELLWGKTYTPSHALERARKQEHPNSIPAHNCPHVHAKQLASPKGKLYARKGMPHQRTNLITTNAACYSLVHTPSAPPLCYCLRVALPKKTQLPQRVAYPRCTPVCRFDATTSTIHEQTLSHKRSQTNMLACCELCSSTPTTNTRTDTHMQHKYMPCTQIRAHTHTHTCTQTNTNHVNTQTTHEQ